MNNGELIVIHGYHGIIKIMLLWLYDYGYMTMVDNIENILIVI